MGTQKLDQKLDQVDIKQTRPIRFKDDAINKIKKQNIDFGKRSYVFFPFIVSKDSHQKGLKLRVYKGSLGDKTTKKVFYIQYWFNGRAQKYRLGDYSQRFGVRECDEELIKIHRDHTDPETGFWIKDPNITKRDEKRFVEKPDTTVAKAYTVNDVIEAYCGAAIFDEEAERGFSKDRKDGYRTKKHAREWFRCMAGYNQRQTLIDFYDDDDGSGVAEFKSNKKLRIAKPVSWRDLFRKFPPGKGILKDRVYYNRRKKQTYTIPASQNYAIYDHDIGKSLMSKLTPGDIEHFIKNLSSMAVKESYVQVFITLWIYARKRGWLGTNPGECPFLNQTVFIKKEKRKEDPYKKIAIQDNKELELFWKCSEGLAPQFPFKAELHQFMLLTAMRKAEALKMKKEYINLEKGTLFIPKAISKTGREDEELPMVPELEILIRNILDYENDPRFQDFYKMRDFPWLFATRKWRADRYFDKKFKMSPDARLGGDENCIPKLRELMQQRAGDPSLKYAPKILRKSYITLSQQVHQGRSEITANMSRHASIDTLNKHYNHPNIETARDNASKVSNIFKFIQRRSA